MINLYRRPQCILFESLAMLTKIFETTKKGVLLGDTVVDCSQPSIFSYFYSIFERAYRITRELDANVKR